MQFKGERHVNGVCWMSVAIFEITSLKLRILINRFVAVGHTA